MFSGLGGIRFEIEGWSMLTSMSLLKGVAGRIRVMSLEGRYFSHPGLSEAWQDLLRCFTASIFGYATFPN